MWTNERQHSATVFRQIIQSTVCVGDSFNKMPIFGNKKCRTFSTCRRRRIHHFYHVESLLNLNAIVTTCITFVCLRSDVYFYIAAKNRKKTKEENVEFNDMRNEKVTEMFVYHIVYEIVNGGICMSKHVHNWHQIAKVFFSSSIFLCGISPRTLRWVYRF